MSMFQLVSYLLLSLIFFFFFFNDTATTEIYTLSLHDALPISSRDIYISQSQIRRFMLRPGDFVAGVARPPKDNERYYGLLKVEKVNDVEADASTKRPYFDDLTAIYPKTQVILTTGKLPLSTRMIDLVSPIGFGQRGMIVSPPKAGKTTILKEIAAGISQNFPKAHLMAALIGERPEEVTDISQSVKGDVIASNFDEPPENQTRVAEIDRKSVV